MECPTGSGNLMNLWEVVAGISHRLIRTFLADGAGIGASHQTGWTGLVAKLIQQCGEYCEHERTE